MISPEALSELNETVKKETQKDKEGLSHLNNLVSAYRAGKDIQHKAELSPMWHNITSLQEALDDFFDDHNISELPESFRIAAEKKKIALTLKDIPVVCHVKYSDATSNDGLMYSITSRNSTGITFNSEYRSFRSLGVLGETVIELSEDLITWTPFYKYED